MKNRFLSFLMLCAAVLTISHSARAQMDSFEKIADETFMFIKAGTFAKPSVSKDTSKLALGQVRVHYKLITTDMTMSKGTSARVSAYLESDLTEGDLQALTEEFHQTLRRKLGALGIEFVEWERIQATEYYKHRQTGDANRRTNGDVKNGQGWLSFTANDGPVLLTFNPTSGAMETVAFGQMKRIKKFCEEAGADMATVDAVVDFASIDISVKSGSSSKYVLGGKKTTWYRGANWAVAPALMVNMGNFSFFTEKMKFDGYSVKAPVVSGEVFSAEPYEDPSKAALKTARFFGTTYAATPVVIETKRERYIAAARDALNLYADLFAEKLRQIRGGQKPQNANRNQASQPNPADTKTVAEVREEARRNNDTSPVTLSENLDAAKQAAAERKWNLAAQYYGEAIKLQPADFSLYFQRGVIYLNELKNYKSAAADFTKALELNPREIGSYYNRGTAYVLTSDWKKAIKDFDAFLKVQPAHVESYLNRGIAYLNIKKTDEAMADFERGLQLNPRLPNLYRARSVAYKVKGNNELAQADELRAAQLERGQ